MITQPTFVGSEGKDLESREKKTAAPTAYPLQ